MSLATPSDGRRRSGSGETQARPGATVKMIDKHALVHYLNEKRLMWTVAGMNVMFVIFSVLPLHTTPEASN